MQAYWFKRISVSLIFPHQSSPASLLFTGKSLSEAFIFASINPQYDNRLFWNYLENYKRRTWAEHWCKNKCFWKRFTCKKRKSEARDQKITKYMLCPSIGIKLFWTDPYCFGQVRKWFLSIEFCFLTLFNTIWTCLKQYGPNQKWFGPKEGQGKNV